MSTCTCCGNKNAFVMKPLCDRCFLGWNGDCCEIRKAIDQTIADSADHVCRDLGFFEVPFSLQIKRINAKIRKENKAKKMEIVA
jgi:hypothetical protein